MEYFNNILEDAVIEILERHKDEIIELFQINIDYEEINELMRAKELKLLKDISNIIKGKKDEDEEDDDSMKLAEIKFILWDNGIYN